MLGKEVRKPLELVNGAAVKGYWRPVVENANLINEPWLKKVNLITGHFKVDRGNPLGLLSFCPSARLPDALLCLKKQQN